jgi:hypothetical protein
MGQLESEIPTTSTPVTVIDEIDVIAVHVRGSDGALPA